MSKTSSKKYSIGEFAKVLNVSTKTLQRWDNSGLLVANRTSTNRRIYTESHIAQYNDLLKYNKNLLTRRKHYKYKDLTNLTYGNLTVIKRDDDFISPSGRRYIQWLCECICGETCLVKGASLTSGYNKSCGCSQYGNGDTKKMWKEYLELKSQEAGNIKSGINNDKKVGRRRIDLQGKVFGWLTALHYGDDVIYSQKSKATTWRCKCNCGNELDVITSRLTSYSVVSCGCMPIDKCKQYKHVPDKGSKARLDLTDKTFGYWTAMKPAETKIYPSGGRATQWLCLCKCGVQKIVPTRDLRSGASQSCGCLTSMSWLEHHVKIYLDNIGVKYDTQVRFQGLLGTGGKQLSYDYLIYDEQGDPSMLIECQGEQHFRPIRRFGGAQKLIEQQIHDKLKRNYALDVLGIPLHEIMYTSVTEADVWRDLKAIGL